MVSNINKTRLPLALKPSNSTTLSSSLDSDETLPPTTPNTDINPTPSSAIQSSSSPTIQYSSSSTLSKQNKLCSITTISTEQQMITKKTKSKSKAIIIKSNNDQESTDDCTDIEAEYDLETCIQESGGTDQFLQTPCLTLYKKKISSQNVENIGSRIDESIYNRTNVSGKEDDVGEETSRKNVSTDGHKRRSINWKGGSKNCGLYMLYDKKQEVRECATSVLSYAREHGTLLSGVQLKALFDVQNVEMTKDRACAVVQMIADSVDIVCNPHFISPIQQRPVFEYYGDDYELSEVQPTKTIPIPKRIMVKCVERENKKKKGVHVNGSKQKEKLSIEMMEDKHSEEFITADDNEAMGINDKDNNNFQGYVKRNTILTDSSVSGEESIANGSISPQNNHLKRVAIDENDYSSNDGIVSRVIEEQVRNVLILVCSPIAGKTDSSITIETRNRSASPSRLNTDNSIKTSSPKQRQVISSQRKQKVVRTKKVIADNVKSKDSKRRSFRLRSKTKQKQTQLSVVSPSKRKENDEDTSTATSIISPKRKKMNNNEKFETKTYKILTNKLGKIPKISNKVLSTITSEKNN
ncbi:unnamed protein product [Rotaria sp. Silwood2]|nr:unnamed protein product [Rotaria sp. Silwood2]CAF2875800.1 unnamed protein product [Rotaria sp. Silwood2]CAF3334594.1 unnamed protein product [Rotaria sp. Silwood2]CAF4397019.1 unnamed protein product [Rotaria sp. Silwood2]CAF4427344.1 unnamed protein product [Rotaria sp. Silwood2]